MYVDRMTPNQLENYVSELISQVEELETELQKYEWISLEDALPEEHQDVLITNGIRVAAAEANYYTPSDAKRKGFPIYWEGCNIEGWDWYFVFEEEDNKGVTHWMPLPDPPTSY
jgi:hypothetical protein